MYDNDNLVYYNVEACSGLSQISKIEFFAKIVNGKKPLNIFAKSTILDVRVVLNTPLQ